uniref:Centriolin n=1 Tax=Denticeps clupeoides TaxID=299321 RepID=A0AAY4ET69_9TELE
VCDMLANERKCHGIRYITEDMILRVSKQDNIAFVQSLNLSVTKTGDKKFKYIENLDKCARLRELNLSHNCIEKVEKLEKLHKLRELNISDNQIIKIEGLEHMTSLEVLNLSDNYIEQLPLWLPKKLRSLQTLNLRNNNISSVSILKLKLLKNLTELVLAENPVCNLPHYRLFLLFHVRSLQVLDGQPVNEQERQQAHQRFHIEEIERLEHELEARMVEIERLQDDRNKALESLVQQEALSHTLQAQNREQRRSQDQMERELETKSELLKQKTMELTRACQKQYELEQELAFHKIDVKFESIPLYFDQVSSLQLFLEYVCQLLVEIHQVFLGLRAYIFLLTGFKYGELTRREPLYW